MWAGRLATNEEIMGKNGFVSRIYRKKLKGRAMSNQAEPTARKTKNPIAF